eukprot:gene7089-biopygen16901
MFLRWSEDSFRGRNTDRLNFPDKVSEAKITDALLLKLFRTTDRDKVKKIVEQQGLDLPARRAQVNHQNHGYNLVSYTSGRDGKQPIRPYLGKVCLNPKEQAELPESLPAGAPQEKIKTAEEAAKAVDRLLYKLGRHGFINFSLSEEERAELDSIGMEELIASFRQAGRHRASQLLPRVRGASVYRGVSWVKSVDKWEVKIRRLIERTRTTIGRYFDEVEAALAYDAAAISLGRTDGLNFPGKLSEAKITDALLLKLFKTTDRDKVEVIVEQHQKEKGDAMSEVWKALLNRKLDAVSEDPEFTGDAVGRKRKKCAQRGPKKKADMSESSEKDIEEEAGEELPMHDDDNVDNVDGGVNDDNEEAMQEDEGTDNVQGQGPAAARSHQDGPVPRKTRKRARRGEGMGGKEDTKSPHEVHAGSRGPGGVGDLLVIADQKQQILYTGGLMAPANLQSAKVVKQEPDCLKQTGWSHPSLVFPAQASMFPAQDPVLSPQELASVLPTSMDTQLGPRIRILSSRTLSYPRTQVHSIRMLSGLSRACARPSFPKTSTFRLLVCGVQAATLANVGSASHVHLAASDLGLCESAKVGGNVKQLSGRITGGWSLNFPMGPKQGTSVYRDVSWKKSEERWVVQILHLNRTNVYIGCFIDEVEAALAYDAAAIALGKLDGLNFPEKVSEVQITDALLLKLFKTTDRDKGLDLSDRRSQVDAQNHGHKFVEYKPGRNGKKRKRPYQGKVQLKPKEQAELPESLWAGASKEKIKSISTNPFETVEEAAKAVDRLSYKLGRHSFINFPLSEEDRTELDSIRMEELIASFRQAGNNNRGTSVYSTYIGIYTDEVEAALACDAAAIALGSKCLGEDPGLKGGKVGWKKKKPAPRGSKKKANMSESIEKDIVEEEEEEEELPMHDDGNVGNEDNGVNDDNEEAIQEDGGTGDVHGQGPAAASSHQDDHVPRKRRRRESRGEGMSGEEDAEPPQEVYAGSRVLGGVGDPLVIGHQQQQIPYTGGLMVHAELQTALVVKKEPVCLEEAVGALPGLVFPAQASMFPAQAPALSSQELALVPPTSMDTHLGPNLLDTMAFESISGWIPLEGGERVTEDEPHAQPPYPQLPHTQLPRHALPHP